MDAFELVNVTFEIGLDIVYTVRLEIRPYQSQVRLAGLVAVTNKGRGQGVTMASGEIWMEQTSFRPSRFGVVIRPSGLHRFRSTVDL